MVSVSVHHGSLEPTVTSACRRHLVLMLSLAVRTVHVMLTEYVTTAKIVTSPLDNAGMTRPLV